MMPGKNSEFTDKSREIAREAYWSRHDRSTYQCPDCGRSSEDIVDGFEVHHINGDPMDNRKGNVIALCPLCHKLREGKKPSMTSIRKLRDSLPGDVGENREVPLVGWRAIVADFADKCTEHEMGAETPKSNFYTAYTEYCIDNGEEPKCRAMFWRCLRGVYSDLDTAQVTGHDGGRVRVVRGMTLRPSPEADCD